MMGNGNDQLPLFPPGNDGLRDESPRRDGLGFGAIKPGDWLDIEHDGRTVVGMIYRRRGETYRFVYWDRMVLRFGSNNAGLHRRMGRGTDGHFPRSDRRHPQVC